LLRHVLGVAQNIEGIDVDDKQRRCFDLKAFDAREIAMSFALVKKLKLLLVG
jgi:hypothetical protein